MCAFCSSFLGLLCLTLLELCIKSIKLHVTKQTNKNSYKDLSTIYNLLKCLFQSSSGPVCISLYIHYFSITWSLCVCMCVCMHAHDCGDICTYTYRGACICFFFCVVDNVTPDVIPQRNLSCVLRQSSSWTWYSLIRAEWPVRKPGDFSSVSFLSAEIINVLISPCSGICARTAYHTQVLMLVWQLSFPSRPFLRH